MRILAGILSSLKFPDPAWGKSVCFSWAVGFFLWANRPGREGDESLPYNADLIMSGAITLLPHIPS